MSFSDWLKRLFSPTPPDADEPATLRAEYGEGGLSGLARVEEAKAREEELLTDDAPADPTA
jgi:hypothetical protein